MTTLLLLFALAYTAIGQTARCPGAYHAVGTGCYTFPQIHIPSWIEASTFCQYSGGYLVNINSENEQIAVKAYLDASIQDTDNRWIGATDMLNNGTWRWVPSGTTVVFNIWRPGFPVSSPSFDCAYWVVGTNNWLTGECCFSYNNDNYDVIKPLCEADPL